MRYPPSPSVVAAMAALLFVPAVVLAGDFENVGNAGSNFLQIPVDAAGASLGNTSIATAIGARSMYWNPGGIALAEGPEATFSYTDWILDTRLAYVGAVAAIGSYGTVGLSVTSLTMDDMEVTTELHPEGTGERFGAGNLAVGVTYGYQVTDRFSWGMTAKYVREYIWDNSSSSVAFDVGSIYRTGFHNLRIGMIISNFGGTPKMSGAQIDERIAEEEAVDEENNPRLERLAEEYGLPQSFNVGLALDPLVNDQHRITLAAVTNDPNDNATRVSFGVEYGFRELLFARGGWKLEYDEQNLSAGVGFRLNIGGMQSILDYAYTDFGILGGIHHFTYTIGQ